jgi:hypothetical protein
MAKEKTRTAAERVGLRALQWRIAISAHSDRFASICMILLLSKIIIGLKY